MRFHGHGGFEEKKSKPSLMPSCSARLMVGLSSRPLTAPSGAEILDLNLLPFTPSANICFLPFWHCPNTSGWLDK